jgi:hypothetical protein
VPTPHHFVNRGQGGAERARERVGLSSNCCHMCPHRRSVSLGLCPFCTGLYGQPCHQAVRHFCIRDWQGLRQDDLSDHNVAACESKNTHTSYPQRSLCSVHHYTFFPSKFIPRAHRNATQRVCLARSTIDLFPPTLHQALTTFDASRKKVSTAICSRRAFLMDEMTTD